MAVLDGPMRTLTQALLGAIGANLTIRTRTIDYVPETGDEIEREPEASATIRASPPIDFTIEQDGMRQQMIKFILPAASISFQPDAEKHELVFSGKVYHISRVIPYYSGDQPAAYEVLVRK